MIKQRLQLYSAVILCWLASLLICATYFFKWNVNLYLVGILFLNAGMLMTHPTHYSSLSELPQFEGWRRWQWIALFVAFLPCALWAADFSLYWMMRLLA